jgi:beta-lactamase class A
MNPVLKDKITELLQTQSGHTGFYFKDLTSGEEFGVRQDEEYLAASVIKFPVFACIAKWVAEGKAAWDEVLCVKKEDKVPICGALTLFTGEVNVDILTLCKLMISISDNCATNMLIKRFGIPAYKKEFQQIGLKNTALNRLLFDAEASAQGIENYIVPEEMGGLLEQVYRRQFVNEETSALIEEILLLQQINHKICGYLPEEEEIQAAHKTGEDENLSNDVGIVFTKKPFIVCFAGHDTSVPAWETAIRQISADLAAEYNA